MNQFKISPEEEIFFKENLDDILKNPETTKVKIDFDLIVGDTIKEKYKLVNIKLSELTNILIRKGAQGFFWMVTSPEIESMLETSASFDFNNVQQIPLGTKETMLLGILDRKWKVYCSSLLEVNQVLIGAGYTRNQSEKYGLMTIHNFAKQ